MKALIFLFCLTSLGFYVSSDKVAEIQIKEGSEIVIEGRSNLNRFSCGYDANITQSKNLITYDIVDNTFFLKDANLMLQSKQFDCGGPLINKDFNKLMQTDLYPNISIKLNQVKVEQEAYIITANIKIAGKSKKYKFDMCHNQDNNYTGELSLNIQDFDLQAPNKLLGAIKVDPVIDINFDMDLAINQNQ